MQTRLFLVGLTLFLTADSVRADWPQWRGPNRNGFVDFAGLVESLPKSGLQPVWTYDSFPGGNSGGWGSPVISDGRVYVYAHIKNKKGEAVVPEKQYPWLPPEKRVGMTDEEYKQYEVKRRDEDERRAQAFRFTQRLVCLDLKTGEEIWDRQTGGAYTRFVQSGTPCVSDGKVFVLGPSRTAVCYDARTGAQIWQARLPGEFRDEYFASSFIVSGQMAVVACGPLVAVNVDDGTVLWQGDADLDYSSHSSPTIWSNDETSLAICNTSGGRTKAYRLSDGKSVWELETGTGSSSPIVTDELLLTYGSSRKSGLTAFRLDGEAKPQEQWQFQGAADSGTTPVVRGDAVFVQGEKRIAKVSLKDGKRLWQATLKVSQPKYTSLIAAGNQVIFGWEGVLSFDADARRFEPFYDAEIDSQGRLIGGDDLRAELQLDKISNEGGGLAKAEKLWQEKAVKTGPLNCATPAFSDGQLVVRRRNSVVCYDLRKQ